MKKSVIFLVFVISVFLFSCEIQEDANLSENIQYTTDSLTYSNALQGNFESDAFFLNTTQREGDILYIEVSYSGGCEMHQFNVIWDGVIYYSEPPQAYIVLTHSANNDACEAFIEETLTIDLKQVFGENYSDDLKLIILNGSE